MCNEACLEFGRRHLLPDEITGKKVLEVGSMDVNGSLRAIVQRMAPSAYVGVDIATGPGVDVVCRVSELVARFGEAAFDTVISTEMLEHVRDWRVAVSNMKRVLRVGGTIVITTRSPGFPYHGYPYDFWRYEPDDMRTIFADMRLDALASDPLAPADACAGGDSSRPLALGNGDEQLAEGGRHAVVHLHQRPADERVQRLLRHAMGASFPALRGMNRSNDAHGLKAGQTQYLTETGFRIARLMGEITVPEVRGERITHIRHLDEQPPPRRDPTPARRQESDDVALGDVLHDIVGANKLEARWIPLEVLDRITMNDIHPDLPTAMVDQSRGQVDACHRRIAPSLQKIQEVSRAATDIQDAGVLFVG